MTAARGEMAAERAWRWCLLATLRDVRRAAARGRAMSRPSAERLFLRRWRGRAAEVAEAEAEVAEAGRLRVRGWFQPAPGEARLRLRR
ncbi:MAG: hypothetical protein WD009_05300 [Phycisphaeraceae bacterium]